MKISRELMVKAHKLAKEIKEEYPEVNYSVQLGICIKFLLSEKEDERVLELQKTLDITEEESIKLAEVEKVYQEEYAEEAKITFNIWERYGKKRAYITCPWRSKNANSHKNFYDLKGNYLNDRYISI
ncbi:MAG: hypothetical protein N4A68_05515 [Maledivibacter sp.]|jgi:hypothetical protein|nr:hypothetical protein [Maledivibacter sp.]